MKSDILLVHPWQVDCLDATYHGWTTQDEKLSAEKILHGTHQH